MVADKFTEISAERFRDIEPDYSGHSVMLFAYMNYSPERPTMTAGLWLSRELVKRQIEMAHYIPDSECTRALELSRAGIHNAAIWLGLFVETDQDLIANLTMSQFMLDDFGRLALDADIPLKVELEERFCLRIVTD